MKIRTKLFAALVSCALLLSAASEAGAAEGSQPGSKDAFVLAGDVIIPQIANGGDTFFMTFQLVNITDSAATVTVSFFDGSGIPMGIPYIQDGAETTATTLSDTIAPNGVEFATTVVSSPATQIGYARVQSVPENSVAVSAAFNQVIPGRPLFQSFVPLDTVLHSRFFMPFVNTGTFTAAMAVVSLFEQDVTFAARNRNGVVLCSDTQSFVAGGHQSFIVRDRLACTDGIDGVIEVSAPGIGLAGFGITAEDGGAFVTQPVYGQAP